MAVGRRAFRRRAWPSWRPKHRRCGDWSISTAGLLQSLWNELRAIGSVPSGGISGRTGGLAAQRQSALALAGPRDLSSGREQTRSRSGRSRFWPRITHKLSGQARLQHLPLAEALKTYAGAKDQQKLESLLEPVRRAAEQQRAGQGAARHKGRCSPRKPGRSGKPIAFSRNRPRSRRPGVVVRLARLVVRPQAAAAASAGAHRRAAGERLRTRPAARFRGGRCARRRTAHRRGTPRNCWPATEGLVLLRGKWVEVDHEQAQASPRPLETGRPGACPGHRLHRRACGCLPAPT